MPVHPEEDADHLYDFGRNIGIAFQLQDDLLDVYGTLEQFGKQTGNDIVANKKTFLLLTALNLAQGEMLETLKYWIEQKDFDREEKVSKAITAVFDELKNTGKSRRKRSIRFMTCACRSLEKVRCDKARKQPLFHFAEIMMNREK